MKKAMNRDACIEKLEVFPKIMHFVQEVASNTIIIYIFPAIYTKLKAKHAVVMDGKDEENQLC